MPVGQPYEGQIVELNPVASWFLVIGFIVFALVTAGALVGLALALRTLNTKLEDLIGRAEPLLIKADDLLTLTNTKLASIGDKAEGILAQGEETAENVHHRVDKTATAVQRTIHAPIIGLNSLAAGISRGVATFGNLQRGVPSSGSTDAHDDVRTSNGRVSTETGSAAALAGKEIVDDR